MNNAAIPFGAPIVGLPMRVGEAYALVSVTCMCRPTNPSLIIRGVDVGAKCSHCGSIYAITKIVYDARQGRTMHCEVGQVAYGAGAEGSS